MTGNITPGSEECLFEKYLGLLGIQRRQPGFKALKEIVAAQGSKVPFENISKLFYSKRRNQNHLVEFELFLEGIEKYGFGGTCYSLNYYLNRLLSWLGYDAILCGADMKSKDAHIVSIVKNNEREYLVDAGYAAPFSVPIPLDLTNDFKISCGSDLYVLRPRDTSNRSRMELYRTGVLKHGYKINPLPRSINDFKEIIADSFLGSATFMNAVLLTRFESDCFLMIHNMRVIESCDGKLTCHTMESLDQLASVIDDRFGIPKNIVKECLNGLQLLP